MTNGQGSSLILHRQPLSRPLSWGIAPPYTVLPRALFRHPSRDTFCFPPTPPVVYQQRVIQADHGARPWRRRRQRRICITASAITSPANTMIPMEIPATSPLDSVGPTSVLPSVVLVKVPLGTECDGPELGLPTPKSPTSGPAVLTGICSGKAWIRYGHAWSAGTVEKRVVNRFGCVSW